MNASPLRAEQGDWLIRALGIIIQPDDSSGLISPGGVPVINSGVEVDTNTVPELDVDPIISAQISGIGFRPGISNLNNEAVSFITSYI